MDIQLFTLFLANCDVFNIFVEIWILFIYSYIYMNSNDYFLLFVFLKFQPRQYYNNILIRNIFLKKKNKKINNKTINIAMIR